MNKFLWLTLGLLVGLSISGMAAPVKSNDSQVNAICKDGAEAYYWGVIQDALGNEQTIYRCYYPNEIAGFVHP